MHGIDMPKLRAKKRTAEDYLERSLELAETDPTRAFSAIDDARKQIQAIWAAIHEAHVQTIRRVY